MMLVILVDADLYGYNMIASCHGQNTNISTSTEFDSQNESENAIDQ